ncbi:MAG: hypothetical protein KUG77_07500 [Nannocystaceae bacterium]|nr:hypothetical protein [Nannocystaceae bacterium]
MLAASVGFVATPALAIGPVAETKAQQETKQVASIKVEIRQESGEVVKGSTQLEWNEDGSLSIEQDGTSHKLDLRVEREGKSKKLSITVAYSRGGEAIVAPYAFDAKVKKREVLRIEGNLAIAVTVTPTKVAVVKEDKGQDKPKLDLSGDEDDPLSGLD